MSKQFLLLAGVSSLTLFASIAYAAPGDAPPPNQTAAPAASNDVIVTADRAGLLEKRPSSTVFGLSKPLIETPRSASAVSAVTIERYGIQTINDLVAVSPSTYTASFYGVPGSLDVRGTLGDNYFLGFKMIENRGTYETPIGDAAQIDIVRGPPSAIYGPGKVGGFLNFVPKSAKSEDLTHPVGEIDATYGSYDLFDINAQGGAPLNFGTATGGIYAYADYNQNGSYYEGIHPKNELAEVSVNYDLPDGWGVSADTLLIGSTGEVQTPGWNRLTPALISSQTYITGRNTTLMTSPGVGYLTPNQATPTAPYYPFNYTSVGGGLYAAYYGGTPATPPLPDFQLNSPGAGTTVKLSPRDVFVGPTDFSNTFVPAVVFGISKYLPHDNTLKLQLFYNGLSNERFVSYGFPAWFRSNTYEARLTDNFKLTAFDGDVTADTIVGGSYRYYQGRDMQSYDDGLIALDRRDLAAGASPTDTICSPFSVGDTGDQIPSNCQGWEFDVHSTEADEGIFATTDISIFKRLDFIVGGRYDDYQLRSSDSGIFANPAVGLDYDSAGPVSASKGEPSFSASVTYKLGWGLMPYFTYAQDNALEVQQAGDLMPNQLKSGGYISASNLTEGGVKFQLLGNTLVGSVDGYLQNRTGLAGLNNVSQSTRSTGVEFEIRYLATRNLSFVLTGNNQHTEVIGPDTGTYYVPAYAVCGNNTACEINSFGGAYLVYDFATSPLGHPGNYTLTTIPATVVSLHADYITDKYDWGRVGVTVGATYVSQTSGTIKDAIVYPAYTLVDASAFYQQGPYEVDVNVTNLTDKLYFTPNSDPTYVNVAVLPGIGREWRVTLKRKF